MALPSSVPSHRPACERDCTQVVGRGPPGPDYDAVVSLTVVQHPLARHLLSDLRNRATPPAVFRALTKRLTVAVALEATRDLPLASREVDTPLERTEGFALEDLVAIPILRAGL